MQINKLNWILLLLVVSCNSNKMIDIQGHRGCRGLLPENSLPAFKKAVEIGVHTLELDVVITKDKKVIVSHEPYMSSVICVLPNGNTIEAENEKEFNIYQMPYDSIKQFDCGSKIHPRFPEQKLQSVYKPLLGEVFEMAETLNPDIKYNIELKAQPSYDGVYSPKPKEFVTLVLNELHQFNVFGKTNLQSFDIRILEEIKRQEPDMEVALLVDENEDIAAKLASLNFTPEIISPYFKLLNATNVNAYQNKGFKVIPWTLNEISDMEMMITYGVDAIITDYPDRLVSILKH